MIFTWAFLFVIFATCFRWRKCLGVFFGGFSGFFFCFWTFVFFFGHSVDFLFLDKVLESAKAVFGLVDGKKTNANGSPIGKNDAQTHIIYIYI